MSGIDATPAPAPRWIATEGGQTFEVPKEPILRHQPDFRPPGVVTLPDGRPRKVREEGTHG